MKHRNKLIVFSALRLVFSAIAAEAEDCRLSDSIPSGAGRAVKTVRIEHAKIWSDRGGPTITVLAQQDTANVHGISGVAIQFDAGNDSSVDADSIRVSGKKGFFKRDYTQRARRCFWFGNQLQISGSLLPAGSYRVIVEVADKKARKSSIQITVRVTTRPATSAISHRKVSSFRRVAQRSTTSAHKH